MKRLVGLAAAMVGLIARDAVQAEITGDVIKIGVTSDMSGAFADLTGQGSVIAARMAVEDFHAAQKGLKVEVIGADHHGGARR